MRVNTTNEEGSDLLFCEDVKVSHQIAHTYTGPTGLGGVCGPNTFLCCAETGRENEMRNYKS